MTNTQNATIVGLIALDFTALKALIGDKSKVRFENTIVLADDEMTYSYTIGAANKTMCVIDYEGPVKDLFKQDEFPIDILNKETVAIVVVGNEENGYTAVNSMVDFTDVEDGTNVLVDIYCENNNVEKPSPTASSVKTVPPEEVSGAVAPDVQDQPVVDTEYDAFADRVASHDKHYQFSDDLNVWRRGDAEHKNLTAIAESKGGRYKQLWDNIYKTTSVV